MGFRRDAACDVGEGDACGGLRRSAKRLRGVDGGSCRGSKERSASMPALPGQLGELLGERGAPGRWRTFRLAFGCLRACRGIRNGGRGGRNTSRGSLEGLLRLEFRGLFEFAVKSPAQGSMQNSRMATPGSFISARRTRDLSRSMPTTRQKSSATAVAEAIGMKAASTNARTADESIHPAANGPEILCGIPAVIAVRAVRPLEILRAAVAR